MSNFFVFSHFAVYRVITRNQSLFIATWSPPGRIKIDLKFGLFSAPKTHPKTPRKTRD